MSFLCPVCYDSTNNKIEADAHAERHVDEFCTICRNVFPTAAALQSHLATHSLGIQNRQGETNKKRLPDTPEPKRTEKRQRKKTQKANEQQETEVVLLDTLYIVYCIC